MATTSKAEQYTVGQPLWFVPNHNRSGTPHSITITKIGRVWLSVDHGLGRVHKETLRVDGGQYSSPGACYLSREAYEHACALDEAWNALWKHVYRHNRPPKGVTLEAIQQARALLGLTKEE